MVTAVLLADPQILTGRVVRVADGDTLTVLDSDQRQHKIRLARIDAPEKKQPFGGDAREALAGRVNNKDVRIEWKTRDRYHRIVGEVHLDGRRINRELVADGWAWHYVRYSKSNELREAEQKARNERRGLWRDENPVPPWEFRKSARMHKSNPP